MKKFLAAICAYLDPRAGAVTEESSTQYANQVASPPMKNPCYDEYAKKRLFYFCFTQGDAAGDAGSLADLVKLPAGRFRLLKTDSVLVCSAFGAGRTLDIGYSAHTRTDGSAVEASTDAILDGADVSAAAKIICGAGNNALGTDPTILIDSREGVTIQAKVNVDTIPAGATLKGYIVVAAE
jgi:hypothetical protein